MFLMTGQERQGGLECRQGGREGRTRGGGGGVGVGVGEAQAGNEGEQPRSVRDHSLTVDFI